MSQEPEELTEEIIHLEALDYLTNIFDYQRISPSKEREFDCRSGFEDGASFAKERLDAYWKARVVEEVEKAFMAGIKWGHTSGAINKEEYINQLKERISHNGSK